MKFLLIVGGSFLTFIFLSLLSLFYILFSFNLINDIRIRDTFKGPVFNNTSPKKILGTIGLGLALSAIIIGALYKLLFWAGWGNILTIGLAATVIIAIIAGIYYSRNKSQYYVRAFRRIVIIGGLGLILHLAPVSKLVDIFFRHHPDYAEALKSVLEDPDNRELREALFQKEDEMIRKEMENY